MLNFDNPIKASVSLTSSEKGKTPWATIDGEPIADTFFIIKRLKSMNYDLDSHLSQRSSAIAKSFIRMIEEATLMFVHN